MSKAAASANALLGRDARDAPSANFCSPPSFWSSACRIFLNVSQRYLKCASCPHSVLSHLKHSVPEEEGGGEEGGSDWCQMLLLSPI